MTAYFARAFDAEAMPAPGLGAMSFAAGTHIATPRGEVPIERLKAGDRVLTRDSGLQKVRWVGASEVTIDAEAPVIIRAGALGHDLPESDLVLAPSHRVLVFGEQALEMFGQSEVFVEARNLTFLDGVERCAARNVTYHQVMFEKHEVVLSNGAWTESYQPADGVDTENGGDLATLFPALGEIGQGFSAARAVVVPRR